MQIRNLPFVLGLIVLGSPTPLYAALGDAPRCLPPAAEQESADANPLVLELRQALPKVDAKARDYMIRTIVFEASGESEEGKAAVAHVILNRMRTGRWGDSVKAVVTHPWQFEPWMTRRKEMERLSPYDSRYRNAARIADAVLRGERPDPTAGATHFLNPTIVRQRRGGSLPAWAQGKGQPIGRHTFYTPNEGDAAPQPTLPLGVMAVAASMQAQPAGGEAALVQAKWMIFPNGRDDASCGRDPITATSPGLPAENLVQLGGW